ncbi:hypothetical protein [Streptomyces bacillaris]|uniref:hypothetical protein n=1 Tax=Streptomyces bacillaris TaxID=68179 RepID=UPI00345FD24D
MPQNPTPAAAGDTNPTTAHDALLQKGLSVYEIAVVLDMHRTEVLTEAADWLTAKYGVTNRAAGDLRRLAEGGAS